MKPLQLTDGAFLASSSTIETIEVCLRKAEYNTLERRISAGDSAALFFGGTLHKAFAMHYRQVEFGTSKEQVLEKVIKVVSKEFETRPESDDFRNLNWAIEVYRRFAERFEFENFKLLEYETPIDCPQCRSTIDQDKEKEDCEWCNNTRKCKVMVEVPFIAKLFDYEVTAPMPFEHGIITDGILPVYYRGFIDLPVSVDNRPFVLDFKSTAKLGQTFWDAQQMSAQRTSYAWGLKKTTNLNPVGSIVRAIRVLEPPLWVVNGTPNKKGEFKKLGEWWNESLVEQKYYLDDQVYDEWEKNTISLVKTFFWHYQNGYFPKQTHACVLKYGKCPYFEVCSTYPESERMSVLSGGLFKDKEDVLIK